MTSILAAPRGLLVTASAAPASAVRGLREDDRQAIEAWKSGDPQAFGRLVERYQRDVYRLCYRYVNNHHDANDMAQEAFLKAYRALDRFRGDSAFSTWLYRIAVNTCLSFRGGRRVQDELPETLPDRRESAQAGIEREEQAREVRRVIATLPEKQRATLILKMYHELSHEEVAEVMGCSVGTVKANLFHAMSKLRKQLKGEERRT